MSMQPVFVTPENTKNDESSNSNKKRKNDPEDLPPAKRRKFPSWRKRDGCSPPFQLDSISDLLHIAWNYKDNDLDKFILWNLIPPLTELDNMIGMKSLKNSVINMITYYIQGLHLKKTPKGLIISDNDMLHTVLYGPPGTGKCLGKDTPVLMYDGRVKMVQDIVPGEFLMGDDSKKRKVLTTCSGTEKMYLVKQYYGDDYVVNESHILSLKSNKTYELRPKGTIIDISISDYLSKSDEWKSVYGGYKVPVDYEEVDTTDPLELGTNIGSTFEIPEYIMYNSKSVREYFLTGVIMSNKTGDAISFGDEKTAKSVLRLCRSLGLYSEIDGNDLYIDVYNVDTYKIEVIPLEEDNYYGFEIDGNRRFLLGDYTVTHNTTVAHILAKIYCRMGFLPTDKVTVAKRSDFLGKYIGQSEEKTMKLLEDALGGVLFIDEAYSMGHSEKTDSFAKAAMDLLNQFLSEHKSEMICIVAGYKKELAESFFSINPGLDRRFSKRFTVDSYTSDDICEMFIRRVKSEAWNISEDCDIVNFFSKNYKDFPYYGGDVDCFFTYCKEVYSRRMFGKENPERKMLCDEDILLAFEEFMKKDEVEKDEDNPSTLMMYL